MVRAAGPGPERPLPGMGQQEQQWSGQPGLDLSALCLVTVGQQEQQEQQQYPSHSWLRSKFQVMLLLTFCDELFLSLKQAGAMYRYWRKSLAGVLGLHAQVHPVPVYPYQQGHPAIGD